MLLHQRVAENNEIFRQIDDIVTQNFIVQRLFHNKDRDSSLEAKKSHAFFNRNTVIAQGIKQSIQIVSQLYDAH